MPATPRSFRPDVPRHEVIRRKVAVWPQRRHPIILGGTIRHLPRRRRWQPGCAARLGLSTSSARGHDATLGLARSRPPMERLSSRRVAGTQFVQVGLHGYWPTRAIGGCASTAANALHDEIEERGAEAWWRCIAEALDGPELLPSIEST